MTRRLKNIGAISLSILAAVYCSSILQVPASAQADEEGPVVFWDAGSRSYTRSDATITTDGLLRVENLLTTGTLAADTATTATYAQTATTATVALTLANTTGAGDMTKSVYDTDDDGEVNVAEFANTASTATLALAANTATTATAAGTATTATLALTALTADTATTASNPAFGIGALLDVDTATTTPMAGHSLFFNGSFWVPSMVSGSTITLTGGDMLKATYDTDNDGIVNEAEAIAGVTASDIMTKPDYDADDDGAVDSAESAFFATSAGNADTLDGINSTGFSLASHSHLLNNLTDVIITGAASNEVLQFNGTDWVDSLVTFRELGDTESGAPATGDIPRFDGSTWQFQGLALDQLSDVSATAPGNNWVLRYDGVSGNWQAEPELGFGLDLDDIGDVDAAAPSDGDVLTWVTANSAWEPVAGGGGGGAGDWDSMIAGTNSTAKGQAETSQTIALRLDGGDFVLANSDYNYGTPDESDVLMRADESDEVLRIKEIGDTSSAEASNYMPVTINAAKFDVVVDDDDDDTADEGFQVRHHSRTNDTTNIFDAEYDTSGGRVDVYLGADDGTHAVVTVFGDDGTDGGALELFNGASEDSAVNAWTMRAEDDELWIGERSSTPGSIVTPLLSVTDESNENGVYAAYFVGPGRFGVGSSDTSINDNQQLGRYSFFTQDGGHANTAEIIGVAAEAMSSTDHGTDIEFWTTPINGEEATDIANRFTVKSEGQVHLVPMASAPASNLGLGDLYVNSGDNTLYFYDGSSFTSIAGAGASDHGSLTGLSDDDHTQYVLADGSRAITGDQQFDGALTLNAEGSELVTNGDFATNDLTGWTASIGTISAGTGAAVATSSDFLLSQTLGSMSGTSRYILSFTATVASSGFSVNIGNNTIAVPSTGSYQFLIDPANTTFQFYRLSSGSGNVTIDNVSVKSVTVVLDHAAFSASSGGLIQFQGLMHNSASISSRAVDPVALSSGVIDGVAPFLGGGIGGEATGSYSVVTGGSNNTASGNYSTVSGGINNTASNTNAVVSGGINNTASATNAVVAGGTGNTASGSESVISGGATNTVSGQYSAILGGNQNTNNGAWSTIAGGYSNSIDAVSEYMFVSGVDNTVTDAYGGTVMGDENELQGLTGTIIAAHSKIYDSGDVSSDPLNSLTKDSGIFGGTANILHDSLRALTAGSHHTRMTDSDESVIIGSSYVLVTTSPRTFVNWRNTSTTTDTINIADAVIFGESIKMGINESNPAYTVDINGEVLQLEGSNPGFRWNTTANANDWILQNVASGNYLRYIVGGSARVIFAENGNVGVGSDTTPDYLFDVQGTLGVDGASRLVGDVSIGTNGHTGVPLVVESGSNSDVDGIRVTRAGTSSQYISIGTYGTGTVAFWGGVNKDFVLKNDSSTSGDIVFQTSGSNTRAKVLYGGGFNLVPQSAAPTTAAGTIYYDSDDNHFYGYNGSTWVQLDNP